MQGPTVFIVDDEMVISNTLAMILNQKGFNATAFQNPMAALEAAPTAQPDVLISDVVMSGMNGIELGRQLRQICSECKVLLISGQPETAELLTKANDEGCVFDILAKPIHPAILLEKLRELIGDS